MPGPPEDDLIARVRARIEAEPRPPGDGGPLYAAFGRRLIELPFVRERPGDRPPPPLPPCTDADVDRAESALGVKFPALLRRLYTEVGEGGFGPGAGIFGLEGLESEYQSYAVELALEQEFGAWPAALVPLCQLDQTLIACIDCSDPAGPIVGFEVDDLDWDELAGFEDAFQPRSPSLQQWLEAWLDGEAQP
ncbi:MAG: SMI1/KNR4 family protein [Acidimicrobiales bacterium]